jgi:hypothetical protein
MYEKGHESGEQGSVVAWFAGTAVVALTTAVSVGIFAGAKALVAKVRG